MSIMYDKAKSHAKGRAVARDVLVAGVPVALLFAVVRSGWPSLLPWAPALDAGLASGVASLWAYRRRFAKNRAKNDPMRQSRRPWPRDAAVIFVGLALALGGCLSYHTASVTKRFINESGNWEEVEIKVRDLAKDGEQNTLSSALIDSRETGKVSLNSEAAQDATKVPLAFADTLGTIAGKAIEAIDWGTFFVRLFAPAPAPIP